MLDKTTALDLIQNDNPGLVIFGDFDPVRHKTARRSLTKLIAHGETHFSKIKKVVEETNTEIGELIIKEGREAASG